MDDSILVSLDQNKIDQITLYLRKAKLDITMEGNIHEFMDINIDKCPDGLIHMTQPHLINRNLQPYLKTKG